MTNKRNIKFIVVHCTATQPTATLEAIKSYWKHQRGWGDTPGYHYIILRNGDVKLLLNESKLSYGAYGHNKECIHIGYIGGIDKDGKPADNRTEAQRHAMFDLLMDIAERYREAKILGHRDFAGVAKACPSFDVKTWLENYIPPLPYNEHDFDIAA